MKKWVVCLLLLALCLSGCAKPAEPVQMHLLTEIVVYKGSAAEPTRPLICRYNENGLLLERQKSDLVDQYYYDLVDQFYYDKKGNLEYRIQTYKNGMVVTVNPEGKVLSVESEDIQRQCTYDARGNLLTETLTEDGVIERNDRYSYVYTKYGDIEQIAITDMNGQTVQGYYRYTYDKQGRKLTEELLRPDGGSDITKYSYNENGDLLKKEQIPQKGKGQTWSYTYDQEGKLLSESYEYSGIIYSTDYTYDDLGRLQTAQYWKHGFPIWIREWTYDDATGELKSRVQTDSDGDQSRREYDFGGRLVTIIGGSKRTEFRYEEVTVPAAFVQRAEAEQEKLIDDYLNPDLSQGWVIN